MSDNAWLFIYDAVVLVCCTALAIAFNKWWLIFLAALFWSYWKKST